MPRMSNGIGTWFCRAGFDAGWGWDDAVECGMLVFFPVYPIRAVHVKVTPGGSFQPEQYQAIPLRMTDEVVKHVLTRRRFQWCLGAGIFLLLLVVFFLVAPPTGNGAKEWAYSRYVLIPGAPILIAIGAIGLFVTRPHVERETAIRQLVGLHALGSSDPLTWLEEDLARAPDCRTMFGTETCAAAVTPLLEARAFSAAMWAARLTAARENQAQGEALTDEILSHPSVSAALERVRKDSKCWSEAVGTAEFKQFRARFASNASPG